MATETLNTSAASSLVSVLIISFGECVNIARKNYHKFGVISRFWGVCWTVVTIEPAWQSYRLAWQVAEKPMMATEPQRYTSTIKRNRSILLAFLIRFERSSLRDDFLFSAALVSGLFLGIKIRQKLSTPTECLCVVGERML